MSDSKTYITDAHRQLWHKRNNNGEGFPLGNERARDCELAATEEGMTILDTASDDGDEVLARDADGRLVLICDLNGPWGCYVDQAVTYSHDGE